MTLRAAAVVALVLAAGCACPGPAPVETPLPPPPADVVESWGRQRDFFLEGGFEILSWEDAKALLLERTYTGGKQYHTGWLTIYTCDGRRVVTKQPEIDAFERFMRERSLPTTGFGTE